MSVLDTLKDREFNYGVEIRKATHGSPEYHAAVGAREELRYVIYLLTREKSQEDYTKKSIDMIHPSPLAGIIEKVESQRNQYGDK